MKKRFLLVVLIAGLPLGGYLVYRAGRVLLYATCCQDCLLSGVEIAADTDGDGVVSEAEWRAVYQEVAVPYDATHRRRFSNAGLADYLDRHWDRIEKYREAHRLTPEQEDAEYEQSEVRTEKVWLDDALERLAGRHGLPKEGIGKDPDQEIPILLGLLGTKDAEMAANVLGHLGKPAVPHLLPLLKGGDETRRRWACFALERIGSEGVEAIPDLLVLLATKDPSQFIDAANAIRKIGPDAKAAVPLLVPWLNAREPYVRLSAARALGGIGPDAREALPQLEEVLKGANENDRPYFRRALRKVEAR